MTFEDLLKNWNGGKLSGACVKLGRKIGAPSGDVARWLEGKTPPERHLKQLAKAFGLPLHTIHDSFDQQRNKVLANRKNC